MKQTIRIPRTTALFVTALGRIIREHFQLKITEHESWALDVTQHEECGRPGDCLIHGRSQSRTNYWDCDPYRVSTYLGSGHAWSTTGRVDFRVRLEEVRSDAMGESYDIQLWVRDEKKAIRNGRFSIFEDGLFYPVKTPIQALPPRRIAFGRRVPAAIS